MPNNREYDKQYNITGEVQFIAEDYRIPVTPEVLPIVEGPKFNFVPTLTAVEQSQKVYALNIDPYNTEETTGSVFERYRRDVKPFEAYVTDKPGSLNAPLMFSIGDNLQVKNECFATEETLLKNGNTTKYHVLSPMILKQYRKIVSLPKNRV